MLLQCLQTQSLIVLKAILISKVIQHSLLHQLSKLLPDAFRKTLCIKRLSETLVSTCQKTKRCRNSDTRYEVPVINAKGAEMTHADLIIVFSSLRPLLVKLILGQHILQQRTTFVD